ncbi:isoleucyl-tRNA synthetase, partial [Reticulomyxa filosa]
MYSLLRRLCNLRKDRQDRVNFPAEEEKILEYWREIKAFETQLEKSKGKKHYTFYELKSNKIMDVWEREKRGRRGGGQKQNKNKKFFENLRQYYGHILAGTIKDVVCRYATQTGHYVERRFGWDTHGLPVEYEIEKALHIN